MKNLLSFSSVFAMLLIISLGACKKSSPPIDCFAAIPDSAFVAQPISFISCSKGANTYLWNFGDGTTATTDSAVHSYTTAAVYHGSLTTSNGQSSTKPFTITVTTNPGGYFTFEGNTFFPGSCDSMYPGVIVAIDVSDSSQLSFVFKPSIPNASGQWTISGSPNLSGVSPGQVSVNFVGHSKLYKSTGVNGNEHLTATLLPSGMLNFTGTNIEMKNYYAPYDSMPISFNVTTTQ